MNEEQLRETIGVGPNELVNTSNGAMDIFKVENNVVYYGFLAFGGMHKEKTDDFLKHFNNGRE
jgi:hypothetical protein